MQNVQLLTNDSHIVGFVLGTIIITCKVPYVLSFVLAQVKIKAVDLDNKCFWFSCKSDSHPSEITETKLNLQSICCEE